MTSFCTLFNLKNIVKEPTCYKNPENPRFRDLLLIIVLDFHKLVVTILRTGFESETTKILMKINSDVYSKNV